MLDLWLLMTFFNLIKEKNKLPSSKSKDIEIKKFGQWFLNQKTNYIKRNKLMKNKIIYNKFKNFLETYKINVN